MPETHTWTLAEAAFVLGEPLDRFKKTVERGPVRPRLEQRGKSRIRAFGLSDLVFLTTAKALQDELTPKAREDLYEAMVAAPYPGQGWVAFGPLQVEVSGFRKDVEHRLKALDALRREIEVDARGEARIKGTRIEAHRIAALLAGGMSVEQVLADYPSLDARQVRAAQAFAEVHPKPGRPYPRTTAKATLGRGGLEVLDEALADA
jgi:uncharacterized protein (DUF433 family)